MIQTQVLDLSDTYFHPAVSSYEGFRPDLSLLEAKCLLIGQPAYSHLVIPADIFGKFIVVFVAADGKLEHDFIKIIDYENGIFLNGAPSHVGSLVKVIRDVMND